jgi:hypothetical protein
MDYEALTRGTRTMPPIVVPPLIAAAALGALAVGRWAMREYRRVNAELDEIKGGPVDRSRLKTLRRDPESGVYRTQ